MRSDFKSLVDSSRIMKVVFGVLTREPKTLGLVITGSVLTTPLAITSSPTIRVISFSVSARPWAVRIRPPKHEAKISGAIALFMRKIERIRRTATSAKLKSARRIPNQTPMERESPFRARVDSLSSQRISDRFRLLSAGLRYLQKGRFSRDIQ